MKKTIMQDKNGNELTLFNGLWWSKNFDRFWQLLSRRDGDPVIVCRLYPGSQPRFISLDGRFKRLYWWKLWVKYGWRFLDPETQQIYPAEREIDEDTENPYAKKSFS